MTTSRPNYAGAVGTTNEYTNPSNAVGSDETACAGPNLGSVVVTGFWNTFSFAIPIASLIILVELKESRNVNAGDEMYKSMLERMRPLLKLQYPKLLI